MAAAAAGGGGGGANIQPNNQARFATAGILKGASLIRSNLASRADALSWFDRYFRQERDMTKNGRMVVNTLWMNALGQEELGLRYDKFLAGTPVAQMGYSKDAFSANGVVPGGGLLIHTMSPRQWMEHAKMRHLMNLTEEKHKIQRQLTAANEQSIRQEVAAWSEQNSPVFYAYILYALTEPLTAEEEENLRGIYGRNGHYDDSRAELQRIISSLTPQNRGGRRRGASHKRRTSKRRGMSHKRRRS